MKQSNEQTQRNAEIRRLYNTKCTTCGKRYYTCVELSKKYNITRQRISRIINNPPKI